MTMITCTAKKQYNHDEMSVLIPKPISIIVNTFDDVAVKEFRLLFQEAIDTEQEFIPIYIDSPGGDISAVFAMLDMMSVSPVPIVTIANGQCMSAGTLLLSGGTEGYRFAAPLAQIMMHDLATEIAGTGDEVINLTKYIEHLQMQMFNVLDTNCNQPSGFFKKYFKNGKNLDMYISTDEAKKINLVNHIAIPEFVFNVSYDMGIKIHDVKTRATKLSNSAKSVK